MVDNQCVCANGGTAETGDMCTIDGANICKSCDEVGFYLNGNSCDEWAAECNSDTETETTTPSSTQNRVCTGELGGSRSALGCRWLLQCHRLPPHTAACSTSPHGLL